MCEAVENLINYEKQESEKIGEKRGERQGIEKSKVESIQNLMINLKVNVKEAMQLLGIPKNEYNKYMKLVG